MKIAFIHLSDIHIGSKRDYDRLSFDRRMDFLNDQIMANIDDVILLITGDIANDGKYDNYKIFGKIIDSLKSEVKERFNIDLKTIAVPGNHDLEFTKEELEALKETKTYDLDYDLDYPREKNRQQQYINFCNSYSIPCVDYVKNYQIRYENELSIEFVMMNSSYFSRFNYIDYGKHHIPSCEIHKISMPTESDIKIGLIHHTLNWFNQESRYALSNTIKNNIQVMFYGHEHTFELQEVKSDNNCFDVLSVKGSYLYNKNSNNSIFNICILDTITSVFSINKAAWNQNKNVYEISNVSNSAIRLAKGNKKYKILDDKLKEITYILDNRDMETFYVFPDMEYQKKENGKFKKVQIHDISEFIYITSDKRIIEIIGKNHNGKTAFSKKIYTYYYKQTNKIPLILDALSCSKKYDKWEKDAFSSFYDFNKYEEFCRLNSEERVLIIDNFHYLKKESSLFVTINKWLEKYSQIIIIENKRGSEALGEELTTLLKSDNDKIKLEILNLKPKKRKQLIYNVCLSDMSHLSNTQINNEANDIEQFLRSQPSFVKFDPVLVMKLTSKYINSSNQAKIDVFHDVFAASLLENIKKGFNDDFRLGEILLSKVAYRVFKNKEYPFRRHVIDDVIIGYNKEYGEQLDCDDCYECLKNTKLIKKSDDNKLIFESSNHLSFYIAKEIQQLKNNEDDFNDYNYLINNISTGINGDIILYLSLLENSIKEGYKIVTASKKNLENVKSLSLLDLHDSKIGIKVIDTEDKQEKRYEKKELETEKIEEKEYYDLERVNFFDSEDQTPEEKKVANALSYLELNCKLFSNFYRDLKLREKRELLHQLYEQSNQTLHLIIKPFVDQYEDIRDEIVIKLIENENITKEKAEKLFEQLFSFVEYNTILDIYTMTSVFSTCKQNVDELINYNYDTDNELLSILNLLFIQRKNEKEVFYDRVKSIFKQTKSPIIKSLVISVFNRYLIYNKVKISNDEQSVISILKLDEKELRTRALVLSK